MDIKIDKFKAIIGITLDHKATDFIKKVAEGERGGLENFSYTYDVSVEKNSVHLEIFFYNSKILDTCYTYNLLGSDDGSIKIVLIDSNGEDVIKIEFEEDFNFDRAIKNHNK